MAGAERGRCASTGRRQEGRAPLARSRAEEDPRVHQHPAQERDPRLHGEASTPSKALDELSVDEREIFRDALRTTMVKRGEEVPTFDQLFDLFWSGFYDSLREAFGEAAGGLEIRHGLEELLRRIAEALQNMQGDLSETRRAGPGVAHRGPQPMLEKLIREAAEGAGTDRIENFLQVGFFSRRTLDQMGSEGAGAELRDLASQLEAAGLSPEDRRPAQPDRGLDGGRPQVGARLHRAGAAEQNHDYMEKFRRETLLEKSFYHLTEDEIRRMREVVERLAQKIKNILSIRRRRLKQGQARSPPDPAQEHVPRRHPVRADLQAAQEGSPEAGDPL